MLGEQRVLVVVAVRSAGQHEFVATGQGVRLRGGDGADQKERVDVAKRLGTRASGGQEHPRKAVFPNGFRGFTIRPDQDRVTGRPGGPREYEMRDLQVTARLGGMGGDGRGVRMCRVDDGVDVRFGQPPSHPLDTAEAADTDLADRQCGIGHPSGK